MAPEHLKKHVQIAYEATTPKVDKTADNANATPAGESDPDDAAEQKGRPWSKLNAIFAKAARKREADTRASAEEAQGEGAHQSEPLHRLLALAIDVCSCHASIQPAL